MSYPLLLNRTHVLAARLPELGITQGLDDMTMVELIGVVNYLSRLEG